MEAAGAVGGAGFPKFRRNKHQKKMRTSWSGLCTQLSVEFSTAGLSSSGPINENVDLLYESLDLFPIPPCLRLCSGCTLQGIHELLIVIRDNDKR